MAAGLGENPEPKAVHAATAVGNYKMVVHGGSTGSKNLSKV
jgi:hypothetical protein